MIKILGLEIDTFFFFTMGVLFFILNFFNGINTLFNREILGCITSFAFSFLLMNHYDIQDLRESIKKIEENKK